MCELIVLRRTDLQRLDKSPEEGSNAFSFAEQLHQPQDSKQTEESDGHFSTFSFTLDTKTCLDNNRYKSIYVTVCYKSDTSLNTKPQTHLELRRWTLTSPWPPPPCIDVSGEQQQAEPPREMKEMKKKVVRIKYKLLCFEQSSGSFISFNDYCAFIRLTANTTLVTKYKREEGAEPELREE